MIGCTQYTLAFGGISHWELLVVLVVALLIFGRRLPDIARSVGRSLTEFKKGINEAKETKDEFVNDVKGIGNEVAKETRSAAGLDEPEDKMS
ncbi:MAG TPA: twin-arginine translocase TatA/TatE family subunit [Sedimentisphaerales bacterium]|jgi:sec-independent protein translocase protein TatA|nr:twin-arginine translocase TatA/TatE family subunit [Sedimentisphaerales bacterium]